MCVCSVWIYNSFSFVAHTTLTMPCHAISCLHSTVYYYYCYLCLSVAFVYAYLGATISFKGKCSFGLCVFFCCCRYCWFLCDFYWHLNWFVCLLAYFTANTMVCNIFLNVLLHCLIQGEFEIRRSLWNVHGDKRPETVQKDHYDKHDFIRNVYSWNSQTDLSSVGLESTLLFSSILANFSFQISIFRVPCESERRD